MKFEEAFELAFDRLDTIEREKGLSLGVTPRTAKTLVLFWNMMKEAKGELDDFVMIDSNNNIVSIDHIEIKKPLNTEVDVFDQLDEWNKDQKIPNKITTDKVGELLSLANEKIKTGVYFHEFMEWLEKKGVNVLQIEDVEVEATAEAVNKEIKDSNGGTADGENTTKPEENNEEGTIGKVEINKTWERLEKVLGKEWYENKNFPEELTEDQLMEIFEKAQKKMKNLTPEQLVEWLVKVHGVVIQDSQEEDENE